MRSSLPPLPEFIDLDSPAAKLKAGRENHHHVLLQILRWHVVMDIADSLAAEVNAITGK
jgi:hypothetical protein